jgi:hypothetical protein
MVTIWLSLFTYVRVNSNVVHDFTVLSVGIHVGFHS